MARPGLVTLTASGAPRLADSRSRAQNGQVPSWGSFSYAFGPLFALGALFLVIVLLRRSFRENRSDLAEDDVLAPVLGPHTWGDCSRLAKDLAAVGIKHRVVDMVGSYQVQVPADDLAAARRVMNSSL